MEVECKTVPLLDLEPIYRGPVLRLSRFSGRFVNFSALLVVENGSSTGATLYLLDNQGNPFSFVAVGPADIITESSKGPNAFSITSSTGEKTVLRAPTSVGKDEWIRVIRAAAHGKAGDLPPLPAPNALTTDTPLVRTPRATPVLKGLLDKKGHLMGRFVRRWFELIPGEGLMYAMYGDSPSQEFKCVPLRGLQVVFDDAKRRINIPPTGSRTRALVLRCARAGEFAQWCEAIIEECATGRSRAPSTSNGSLHSILPDVICATSDPPADESEDLFELEDLQRDTPSRHPAEPLESIGETFHPARNTPGMEGILKRYFAQCVPYGIDNMLERLRQRFVLPIIEPYEIVNEHLVLLDLDVQGLRECLKNTLRLYGEEVAVREKVMEMDFVLCAYRRVRERLQTRLEIAAFREQRNQCGLPLGVNGTVNFVKDISTGENKGPGSEEALNLWKKLNDALLTFRIEFDMFDESEDNILFMEGTINKLQEWLKQIGTDVMEEVKADDGKEE